MLLMAGRGTLLNAVLVALGGLIGWVASRWLVADYQAVALSGLGIVTMGLGFKMLLGSKSVIVVAAAVAIGGMIGIALGIQHFVESLAESIRASLGLSGDGNFVDIVIATSVLYCVGPMTLLGCIQDRLERNIELLALKSTMDGIVAIFFGASGSLGGVAMLVTAVIVLVFQGLLTWCAGLLQPIVKDEAMLADLSGAGGVMLVGTGLGLLSIKQLHVANYIPALVLAPLFIYLGRKVSIGAKKDPSGSPQDV